MKQLAVLLLPSGWDASPSQDTQHEVTMSITTPPLDGMLVHHRIPSMKQLAVLLLPLDGMLVHHRIPSMKQLAVLLLSLDGMLVHHRILNMKQLAVLLLPSGWDASPSQDT